MSERSLRTTSYIFRLIDTLMIVSVERSDVSGEIYVPPSKSYTHRAIIISALGHGGLIKRPLISEDTKATISAVEAFGALTNLDDDLEVAGIDGKPQTPDDVIDVKNSGTTLRLMSAVAALTDGAVLTGDSSIRRRPNGPLIRALSDLGAKALSVKGNDCAPLVIWGKMRGGKTQLDGSVSSQFLSALLIAGPLAENDSTIEIVGGLKSRPYVEITLEMLRQAGAQIDTDFQEFNIKGRQEYDLGTYTVPGDFSSASYPLAAAAITRSQLTIKGVHPSSQGDAAIVDILEKMGVEIYWDQNTGVLDITGGSPLKGVKVDASLTPDLVPTIAVLGAVARGKTIIENAEHVRHKETDRLHAMAVELSKMGSNIEERPDGLIIEGGPLNGAHLNGHHDHRIVMALTIAGMVVGDTTIDTAESVSISYPEFFKEMKKIGVLLNVEPIS